MVLRRIAQVMMELIARLFRRPGFAVAVILALALGIGANTATLGLLYGYLLAPLPYPGAERLMDVFVTSKAFPGHTFGMAYDTYAALRADAGAIAAAGVSETRSFNLDSDALEAHVTGAAVSASLFTTLGVRPVLGRVFGVSAERRGVPGQVVLSYSLWKSMFGGSPDALGRLVRLNGRAYTVVGVMPARFDFPQRDTMLWIPVIPPRPDGAMAGFYFGQIGMIARVAPGITPALLRTQARSILARQITHFPPALKGQVRWFGPDIGVRPLRTALVRQLGYRLNLAQWVTGLLLALVWFNLANLFIARALARRNELLMRQVLGADTWVLLRELLFESLPLCVIGGTLGFVVGHALLTMLLRTGFGSTRIAVPANIWQAAALIALSLSVLSSLVFSVTALSFIRRDVAGALKEADAHSTGGRGELRVRTALVTAQLALAAVLCATGAMLVHGLMHLERVHLGFRPAHVLTMQMYFPSGYAPTSSALDSLFVRMHSSVVRLPGVRAAAIANQIPFGYPPMCSMVFPYPAARLDRSANPLMFNSIVGRGYFRTMGVPLRLGEEFAAGADQAGMVLDAAAAKVLFGPADAMGRTLTFDTAHGVPVPKQALFPVIGVVGDTRLAYTIPGLDCKGIVYRNLAQVLRAPGPPPRWPWYLAIRTPLPAAVILPELHRVLATIAPGVPIYDVRSLDDRMTADMRPHRNIVTLGLLLACSALAVAAVGIYAVQSYAVTRRRAEFGIRRALGATRKSIFALVLGQTLVQLSLGMGIGLTGAAVLGRVFAGALYGVRAFDPLAALLVMVVLSLITLVGGGIPAWRASRVPPIEALRDR